MPTTTRYRLMRTIASGGMAQVYEAVAVGERGFERRVAIKRVLPEHAQDEAMQRMFFDEANIASHLHHGNIVQVLDYGVVDATEFIAMEFVDGLDARRACKQAQKIGMPLSEPLAFHIAAEVAYALDYAHGRASDEGAPLGIVHRDVSPQNILLSWDGDVKLSDFGIAASFEKEEKTATGVVKGKLPYMPPEQAMGKKVDSTADVYALGASLHAMLAGAPPMSDPEQMARRFAGEEIEISDALSEDAADLVRRCMSPDVKERPSAASVAFRAGQLANKRLKRDARGALRDWITPMKGSTGRRGGLDDLMGLCLVSTMADDRQFTVSREGVDAPARLSTVPTQQIKSTGPVAMEDTLLADESTFGKKKKTPMFARLAAGVAVLGALALTAWGVTLASSGAGAPEGGETLSALAPPPVDTEVAPPEPTPASAEGETPDESEAALVEEDTANEAVVPADEPRATGAMMRRRGAMTKRPSAMMAPEMAEAPASRGTAWLRVGHPRGAGQERVFVDGRPVGYTPNLFQVGVGSHVVEVKSVASGETVSRRTLNVRADQTRASPAVMPR